MKTQQDSNQEQITNCIADMLDAESYYALITFSHTLRNRAGWEYQIIFADHKEFLNEFGDSGYHDLIDMIRDMAIDRADCINSFYEELADGKIKTSEFPWYFEPRAALYMIDEQLQAAYDRTLLRRCYKVPSNALINEPIDIDAYILSKIVKKPEFVKVERYNSGSDLS